MKFFFYSELHMCITTSWHLPHQSRQEFPCLFAGCSSNTNQPFFRLKIKYIFQNNLKGGKCELWFFAHKWKVARWKMILDLILVRTRSNETLIWYDNVMVFYEIKPWKSWRHSVQIILSKGLQVCIQACYHATISIYHSIFAYNESRSGLEVWT